MDKNENLILVKKDELEGIAYVTINRPKSLNSLTKPMMTDLARAFKALDADESVGVIILSGSGRSFCSGVDLTAAEDVFKGDVKDIDKDPVAQMERCRKPIIGAISGFAITAGFEIALACDILIASTDAKFIDTHARFGIFPSWGLSQKLSRIIGPNKAREVSLTAGPLTAEKAEKLGLVNHVVESSELLKKAREVAEAINKNNRDLVLRYKAVINDGVKLDLHHALMLEKERAHAYYNGMTKERFKKMQEFIAGGQQQNDEDVQEVQEVQKRRQTNKAEKRAWTPVEETALAKAWVHISTCRSVGNEQTRDGFWKRILEHFKQNVKDTTRTFHGLNTKWKNMNVEMSVFNGLFIQQKRFRESGCSDVDIMKNVLVDYNKKTGKCFTHIEAWEIVRLEDKWLEQPDVAQASSSHSDKRRKSSESGNYESGSNDNTVIPDLNDDTTPIRKRKGKKAESESSTKGSVAASFDTYTARKTQLLETVVEKKIAKDEMAEKLLATQIRIIEEKHLFRAMKFYNEPHDHITDPNMLAFTLAKKRELAEKYGCSCDF